jgi:hypothetical protein
MVDPPNFGDFVSLISLHYSAPFRQESWDIWKRQIQSIQLWVINCPSKE